MSSHHWIQGHCTSCGVKREKVRVQGPCVWTRGTMKDFAKALDDLADKELGKSINERYASLDPHNIKHVVVAAQNNPDAFESDNVAHLGANQRPVVFMTQDDPVEGVDPYQLGLALGVPQPNRSIEPHKKRREK